MALPWHFRAAAMVAVGLGVGALFVLLRGGPTPPGPTPTVNEGQLVPSDSSVGAGTPAPSPLEQVRDTINSLGHARLAADSMNWDRVLAFADSARHDTTVRKKRDRREIHELEARALAARGDTARAVAIYATLIKADTNFLLTPRWLTPRDSAAYRSARDRVMATLHQSRQGAGSGGTRNPRPSIAEGFVLITSNPASTMLVDNIPQGTGELAATRVELPVGAHTIVLKNSRETSTFPTQVSAGATSLVAYDPAKDGAALIVKDSVPPGAFILLDEQLIGPAPFTLTGLPPGKHVLAGELNGKRVQKTITLKSKKSSTQKLSLK
jgi:hypothetical protein